MNKLFYLLFLFSTTLIYPQNQANNWYFGLGAGISFNSGTPVALLDGQLYTDEGCASISDNNGQLLFYTDGVTVYNRDHTILQNGTGLKGHYSATHSAIVLPRPGSLDQYYIFTVDVGFGTNGLQYSLVDMSLDGGLGAITVKNIQLISRTTEKVVAYKIVDTEDYWIVSQRYDSNEYLAYKVSENGVDPVPVVSAVGVFNGPGPVRQSKQMKISPDGKRLAMSNSWEVQILDFDENTGQVSNPRTILPNVNTYGIEFSPDSKLLYVSYYEGLSQFDLSGAGEADIAGSRQIINTSRGEAFGSLQLGPDQKIYGVKLRREYLDVIHNPNALGMACDYRYNDVYLQGRRGFLGLPTFISNIHMLTGNIQVQNTCLGESTDFSFKTNDALSSIVWDFGDGAISNLETPSHNYTASGTYTVSVTVSTATRTTTETRDITIYESPVANVPLDYEVCSPQPNYGFDLSTKDNELLGAQLPSLFGITYHSTFTDAQEGNNALPALYTNSDPVETIYARVFNRNQISCYAITDFDLVVMDSPVPENVSDWTVCDSDLDGVYDFDLSLKDTEILGSQEASKFRVTYYLTQLDAENGTGSIGPDYANTMPSEEVFYRVENAIFPECHITGSFRLEVLEGVTAHVATAFEICDDDNDGFAQFYLSTKDMEIIGNQNPSSTTVSYYSNPMDADNRTNPLNKVGYSNSVGYRETVYARVENSTNTDCYDVSSFDLVVHDAPVLQEVTDWAMCDTDNDGRHIFDLSDKDNDILGNQNGSQFSVSYYGSEEDALSGQYKIVGPYENTANLQTIYYRLENRDHSKCYVTDSFMIRLMDTPTAYPPTDIVACDINGTGTLSFELSALDAEVLNGQDPDLYEINYFGSMEDAHGNLNKLSKTAYTNTALQETLFARVQTRALEQCYDIVHFTLNVNELPRPHLDDTYVICPDSPDLILDGGDFETWEWTDELGTVLGTERIFDILDIGEYRLKVTATNNGVRCENTTPFEVVSSGAPEDFTYTMDGFSDKVSVTIDASGTGEFEYSLDGENFQEDQTFQVFPGEHTFYVRDRFLCRTIDKTIMVLGYQKFFTPNGDGTNEYWNVIGAGAYPNSVVHIYDRYGKLVKQLSPKDRGWDGAFQGRTMPSADYWFRYAYGDGKSVSGHFSLKR